MNNWNLALLITCFIRKSNLNIQILSFFEQLNIAYY